MGDLWSYTHITIYKYPHYHLQVPILVYELRKPLYFRLFTPYYYA